MAVAVVMIVMARILIRRFISFKSDRLISDECITMYALSASRELRILKITKHVTVPTATMHWVLI